jgi:NAD(P)-dependent dehydrogenase (short-subunit alcohol dehydrogenase family)
MEGKTVVITGATSGIGEIAAERLAQVGARIVLIARDKSRGEATLARLHEKAPDLAHTVHYANLTRIFEMKRVAAEIASQEPRIDILINNAGAMFANRRLTEDGLECTFALNHMAYFVVTEGLRERLLASAPARIVNTASAAHQGARLDFDDLQLAKSFGSMSAYGRPSFAKFFSRANLLAGCKGRGSPPIAGIPASSRPASATRAAA